MSNPMHSAGLEVVPQQVGLETVKQVAVYPDQGAESYDKGASSKVDQAYNKKNTKQLCGLKRKTFWILIAAAFVILLAAALGGGLGGGLSQRTQTPQPPQTQQLTSSAYISTSTSSSTGSSPSITAEVGSANGQQKTLYRDCPAANDTHYSVQQDSTAYEFRKLCNIWAAININPIIDYVNQPTTSLNDCINLCTAWNENNVTKSDQDQICSAVCWRNGFFNDGSPGQCFGYMANNDSSPGGFNLQANAICDAGVWINQK